MSDPVPSAAPSAPCAGPGRIRRIALWAGLLLLAAIFLLRGWPAIDPPSLWLDDEWVAVLVDAAPAGFLFGAPVPCPPGFVLLLRGARALLGGSDAALQALPFACGAIQIPLLGALAFRLTGNAALGLLAATLLCGNPVLAAFSARVKPFSLDALASIVLLLLAAACLRRPRAAAYAALCATAAIAPLFSFPAIFLGPILVVAAASALARRRDGGATPLRRAAGWGLAATGLAVAAIAGTVLLGRGNPSLFVHWRKFYLPLGDVAQLPGFLAGAGQRFFTLAFPAPLAFLALLVPAGLWALWARREDRPLAPALAAFYLAVAAASALQRFPVGGGRTDLFAHPVTILLAVAAVGTLGARLRAAPLVAAAIAVGALAWTLREGPVRYPPTGDAVMVRRAAAEIEAGDGLVVYPWSNWAVAHYGPWRVRLTAVGDSTSGYYAEPERAQTLVLRETLAGAKFEADPAVVERQLRGYLAQAPPRLHYVALWGPPEPHAWIVRAIAAAGYRPALAERSEGSIRMRFERGTP